MMHDLLKGLATKSSPPAKGSDQADPQEAGALVGHSVQSAPASEQQATDRDFVQPARRP